jgi:hypothetical protein
VNHGEGRGEGQKYKEKDMKKRWGKRKDKKKKKRKRKERKERECRDLFTLDWFTTGTQSTDFVLFICTCGSKVNMPS